MTSAGGYSTRDLLVGLGLAALIAVLAVPTLAEFGNIRERAALKESLARMHERLILHYNDQGYFPPTGSLDALVALKYLQELPNDPFTPDLPPSESSVPGLAVEEEGDYYYHHEPGGSVTLYARSHPDVVFVIDPG